MPEQREEKTPTDSAEAQYTVACELATRVSSTVRAWTVPLGLLGAAALVYNLPLLAAPVTRLTAHYAYHLTPMMRYVQVLASVFGSVAVILVGLRYFPPSSKRVIYSPSGRPVPVSLGIGACDALLARPWLQQVVRTAAPALGFLSAALHFACYLSVDIEDRWPLTFTTAALPAISAAVALLAAAGAADVAQTIGDVSDLVSRLP